MLMVTQLAGFGVGPTGGPSVAFLDAQATGSDLTEYTQAYASFGAEAADRHLIAAFTTASGGSPTVVDVGIGTVTPTTQLLIGDGGDATTPIGFYGALVPSGASGNLVVEWSTGCVRFVSALWAVYGLNSLTPRSTGRAAAATVNMSWDAGDLVLGLVKYNGSITSFSNLDTGEMNANSGESNWSGSAGQRIQASSGASLPVGGDVGDWCASIVLR